MFSIAEIIRGAEMGAHRPRRSVVAVGAVLLIAGCGSTIATESTGSADVQVVPSTSEVAPEPAPTTEAPPAPTTTDQVPSTPTDLPEPNNDSSDAGWAAAADAACQQAIDEYQKAKASSNDPDPSALAVVAASAVNGAAHTIDALPTPPSAQAASLAEAVRDYAAGQRDLASAMVNGSFSAETQASNAVEAAGEALTTAATDVGASACVAMTNDV